MSKVKEMRLSIQNTLILFFNNMGMDAPQNIEDITDFVMEDVQETADPNDWHSGDVAIGFRRWIEAQAKDPDENVQHDHVLIPVEESIWADIRNGFQYHGEVFIEAYLSDDDMEDGKIIAKIVLKTKTVIYMDDRARDDNYAQEKIQEVLNKIK